MTRSDTRRHVLERTARVGAAAILGASLVAGAAGRVLAVNGGACNAPYDITVAPSDFTDGSGRPNAIDNPYFPLVPGTSFRYEGMKEGASLVDVMTVTGDTRVLMGVTVSVVRDTAYEDGVLAEDTFDWYAQDDAGNVWYFGEDTTEYNPDGTPLTTEGSWEAGQHGNLPGLLMQAQPRSGDTYRQEYAPDVAVDMATVISTHRHIDVPYGPLTNVVETKEFSCIEKTIDHKFYAPGVGLVRELAIANGRESTVLVSKTP